MIRHFASYLVLLAIVLAGLIPAGWMPAANADGKVLLVICTTEGVQEQWVDMGGNTPPVEQMDDRSCPFAAVTTAAVLAGSFSTLPLDASMTARWDREVFTHHTAGFHWRYDARGPPALS